MWIKKQLLRNFSVSNIRNYTLNNTKDSPIKNLTVKTLSSQVIIRNHNKYSNQIFKRYQSSCPSGTKLNLDIYKDGSDPIALPDDKYPDWLWSILKDQIIKADLVINKQNIEQIAKDFSKFNNHNNKYDKITNDNLKLRKKQLRLENKNKIKQNNYLSKL